MKNEPYTIAFRDSCNFLSSSLAGLENILRESGHQFDILKQAHAGKYTERAAELLEISQKKGIFPYDFLTEPEKFDCKELPPAEHFKNTLNNEDLDEMEPSQEVLEARREEAVKVFEAVG